MILGNANSTIPLKIKLIRELRDLAHPAPATTPHPGIAPGSPQHRPGIANSTIPLKINPIHELKDLAHPAPATARNPAPPRHRLGTASAPPRDRLGIASGSLTP
ncbi:hypothetical protein [Corynebacterium glucuronolyticum]|uniref:Uncharacterized protein n=1 Tax=Corynebacterium glucuronolyticum TaxID=39791 RepID=A0AAX1L7C4_9CORY|nr:hypothetical protein [Corynebacterium glucuronolyticum]QRP70321.1 hypothetical protein I6J21_11265 [Corynebacterium glucuronolyticum]